MSLSRNVLKISLTVAVGAALFLAVYQFSVQFDNIPILCLLLAIYCCLRFKKGVSYAGWLLVTVGVAIKHEILQQLVIFLSYTQRSRKKVFLFFGFGMLLFLAAFLPYWREGSERILRNVFQYGGIGRPYGFIFFDFNLFIGQLH